MAMTCRFVLKDDFDDVLDSLTCLLMLDYCHHAGRITPTPECLTVCIAWRLETNCMYTQWQMRYKTVCVLPGNRIREWHALHDRNYARVRNGE